MWWTWISLAGDGMASWNRAPGQPGLRPYGAGARVHAHALQGREVDHHAAVAGREAWDAVAAAAHRHDQVLAAGELERTHDVGDSGAARDERWPAVVGGVPDRAPLVVVVVAGPDDAATHDLGELGHAALAKHGALRLRRHVQPPQAVFRADATRAGMCVGLARH
jgi:hypothetical protein